MTFASRLGLGLLLAAVCSGASAAQLVINSNASDPVPRAAWAAAIERYRQTRPSLEVKVNVYDHESYKRAVRGWLTASPPDVIFWFAGARMRELVAANLLEDVSGLFEGAAAGRFHRSALELVSDRGRQYGAPYTLYQIGFYIRRDVLARAGVAAAPRTWAELISVCEALKRASIEPFAIGTRDLWPAAAWFDYISLRMNGHETHMQLMNGQVSYTDDRVRRIFLKWRELIDRDCFTRNHASLSWQESQSLLYQGKAAMMLIGNFIVANFPPQVRDQIDFAPFPEIDPGVGRAEEAPLNSLHIPAGARNKSEARRFLAHMLSAEAQEALNRDIGQIPANLLARTADDRFLVQGRALIEGASALSQYLDRDTQEEIATSALKGFQEFMLHPDRLDAILTRLELVRARVYKN